MKKIHLLSLIIFLSSCSSYKEKRFYRQIATTGYVGLSYRFSDNGNRSISIFFTSDSTMEIRNRTSIPHNHYLLNFNSTYTYTILDIANLYVNSKVVSNKKLSKSKYIKPYSNKQIPLDSTAIEYVFPDIEGDTIRFSSDLKRLQIRDFNFDRTNNRP